MEHPIAPLAAWANFAVIVGSASAALIGLQFVVIVLGANRGRSGSEATANAFGTPTIVHFCAVLSIAAVLSAPWPTLTGVAVTFGLCGAAGVVYAAIVVQRTRRQTTYKPVLEDWIFHCALPLLAYGILLLAALFLPIYSVLALFVVGGTALLLLFVGIHNAWDSVVYIAMHTTPRQE